MRPWCFFFLFFLVEPSRWRKTEQNPPVGNEEFFLEKIHKNEKWATSQGRIGCLQCVCQKIYVLGVKCRVLSGISIWGGIRYGHAGVPLRINLLIIELRIIHPRSTPRKTNMTMENQPIEGVSKRLSHTCLHLMWGTFIFQTKSRDSFVSFLP